MPAKIVTFGISKGGCSKSTSSGITAHLLSQDSKVLAIDLDSQGNLTSFLTGEYDICTVFEERTIKEAILQEDARPYIIKVRENLSLIPANDYLATLSKDIHTNGLSYYALENALEPIMDDYDWIIIDTPPALGDQTIQPLCVRSAAGSYAVIMFDGSMFAYFAIQKFLDIIEVSKERFNPDLQPAGILFSLIDARARENEPMKIMVDREYPGMAFESVIKRRATTRRLALTGFEDNKEIDSALEYYIPFVEELKNRVQEERYTRSNK